MEKTKLFQFKNIRKKFSGNTVLDGVDFSIAPGEIVALAGENGAGKSTLMNILFGMEVIHSTGGFEGALCLNEKPITIGSPEEAMKYGIGMVHQEFMLIPGFTVGRNIKLNRENLRNTPISKVCGETYKLLNEKAINESAKSSLDHLGLNISPAIKTEALAVGYRQFVEIAREINKTNLKLLVLDEPTAVLTETEASRFIECIKNISRDGISVIFISHRLSEIFKLADRVIILRDGSLVFDELTSKTTKEEIAEKMVGRNLSSSQLININRNFDDVEPILELKNFSVNMPGERTKEVFLQIKKGEILGIGGLAGHGKAGISNGIFNMYDATGEVLYKKKPLHYEILGEALNNRFAFVSEDRKGVGLLLDESIALNIVYSDIQVNKNYLKKYGPIKIYDHKRARKEVESMIKKFDIRCTSPDQKVGSLSGGNQQKVCMARALLTKPEILFVSEPTRGIDIGAKNLLLNYLIKINKEEGTTIVMTSSELNELRSICDRIAIITDGKVQGILPPDSPEQKFALLMSGETLTEENK